MAPTKNSIEIPLSKKKITLILIGSIVFVVLGVWFVMEPDKFSRGPLRNPTVVTIVGIAAIVFFGICALYALRKLPDNKPGLIMDESGLTDNSSAVSAGHIRWADINDLSVITIQKQKFILLHVNNPQDYIDRQRGSLKRKMMQLNFKLYGSPLTLNTNGLKVTFDELHKLITERVGPGKG
jgi:hypothetical protein